MMDGARRAESLVRNQGLAMRKQSPCCAAGRTFSIVAARQNKIGSRITSVADSANDPKRTFRVLDRILVAFVAAPGDRGGLSMPERRAVAV